MKTFDGTIIEVGAKVYILQVPVLRQHEFKIGTVVKVTDKQVWVQYERCSSRYNYEPEVQVVKRYPEQLIAMQ